MNLMLLIEQFPNEEACRDYLEQLRWPEGVRCPRCDHNAISRLQNQDKFECSRCEYQFSVTSGTIFHDTHLALRKWFIAAYLICESKKGISAAQIGRTLGVTYKTAWYLCHRIREAMGNGTQSAGPTLFGIVEVDETLVGGKRRGVGSGNRIGKTWVAGAVQRGGQIRLEKIPNIRKKTLHSFIAKHVRDETEAIYTDELRSHIGLEDHDTRHETVDHSAYEWVFGDVHTNSVEGIWSLLKRSIMGSFHKISAKHLEAYLDELEWRFNNRKNPFLWRDTLRRMIASHNLKYSELTA